MASQISIVGRPHADIWLGIVCIGWADILQGVRGF